MRVPVPCKQITTLNFGKSYFSYFIESRFSLIFQDLTQEGQDSYLLLFNCHFQGHALHDILKYMFRA